MLQQVDTVLAVGMSEAARRLGLSPRTVATLVSRRQLASRKVDRLTDRCASLIADQQGSGPGGRSRAYVNARHVHGFSGGA